MKIVSVSTSKTYDVVIGENLLSKVGEYVAQIRPNCTAAIISDTNVWPHYGSRVIESLHDAGLTAIHFVFPAGEVSKDAGTYLQILNFLAENRVTRSDLIIALGGGVVGDIAGFAAATYLRGISYIQIPTTLLAMVDSSVGGKTAIDLEAGKNLVGAFKQPSLVLCDISTLATLPKHVFIDGCAEVIKYGMLYDAELVEYLSATGLDFDREYVISKCVAYKRDVVQEDEYDTGARQKLNFGHTIGHAIEAMSEFQVTHGMAVAAGMTIVTKAAVHNSLCSKNTYHTLTNLLRKFGLPVNTDYTTEELYLTALSDKKRSGGSVNLIVPRAIGVCEVIPVPVIELKSFIEAGL